MSAITTERSLGLATGRPAGQTGAPPPPPPPPSPAGRRLTICLISEEFPPETVGGIGTYTADLARGLVRLGHRVHVVTRTWGDERTTERAGVQVHGVRVPEPSWAWGTWWINLRFHELRHVVEWGRRAWRAVGAIRERESLDVIECPEYHAQAWGALLATSPVPVVVKLHTPAFLCRQLNGTGIGGSGVDVSLSEWSERWAARLAATLTTPSAAMAADVAAAWHLDPRAVRVVPNPVDEALFAPGDPHGRIPDTVVFAGRIERRKGVETLAKAIPLIARIRPNLRVRLVGRDHPSGPGGGSMTDHLRGLLREGGVHDRVVEFAGPVTRDELPAIYRSAAVCVVPSLYESFGYTCVEAMATGAPVVASRSGALAEIVTAGHDGVLVAPASCEELAAGIVAVLSDADYGTRLGRAARRTVEARYGSAAAAAQTVAVYRSLPGVRP